MYRLCLETATEICSLSLWESPTQIVWQCAYVGQRLHAQVLAATVQQTLQNLSIKPNEVEAVGFSAGPGSYTGLRVGLSFAKGFCYALGIPLVAYSSLEALTQGIPAALLSHNSIIVPMIDARRMEVYLAGYNTMGEYVLHTSAEIIIPEYLLNLANTLQTDSLIFVGNGVSKCMEVIQQTLPNAICLPEHISSAAYVGGLVYSTQPVPDIATYQPVYLKDVATTVAKNRLMV